MTSMVWRTGESLKWLSWTGKKNKTEKPPNNIYIDIFCASRWITKEELLHMLCEIPWCMCLWMDVDHREWRKWYLFFDPLNLIFLCREHHLYKWWYDENQRRKQICIENHNAITYWIWEEENQEILHEYK